MSDKITSLEVKMNALENRLVNLEQEKQAAEQEAQRQARSAKRAHRRAMYVLASTLATMVLVGAASYLMAQTAPLTYSGYLEQGGKPINGKKFVTATLWKSSTSQLSSDFVCNKPTTSSQGISKSHTVIFVKGRFKVPLENDCVTAIKKYKELWIQIEVDGVKLSRQKLTATPESVISRTGGRFQCVPKAWTYGGRNKITQVCADSFTLPYDAVVVASVTGHWSTKNGSGCTAVIGFDLDSTKNYKKLTARDVPYRFGTIFTNSAIAENLSMLRVVELKAGRHTIDYNIRSTGDCDIFGSALQGFYLPK